ncbi:hypothetical protein KNU14_gp94 [Gordonia phage Buggaboo]|uniref:Uncharacterized protein n=1 Tax=Gordonia phage Buggaboo TaxID=2315529 RepID=A0A386KDJ1_9CAUD|nr:hypothetical protein KNU14_gp94 [Gordonia phage Buggaboo]AVE00738.1 hypothetical protein SEA_SUPERSULLEY_86 [Gordonia phage SuperSulley]AYD83286.1 hypothetical protein SEA_BUGGABOO_94 [Gordonia phage Buggaboo]
MLATLTTPITGTVTAQFDTMGEASEWIVDVVRAQYGPARDGVRITGEGMTGDLVDDTHGVIGTWSLA